MVKMVKQERRRAPTWPLRAVALGVVLLLFLFLLPLMLLPEEEKGEHDPEGKAEALPTATLPPFNIWLTKSLDPYVLQRYNSCPYKTHAREKMVSPGSQSRVLSAQTLRLAQVPSWAKPKVSCPVKSLFAMSP